MPCTGSWGLWVITKGKCLLAWDAPLEMILEGDTFAMELWWWWLIAMKAFLEQSVGWDLCVSVSSHLQLNALSTCWEVTWVQHSAGWKILDISTRFKLWLYLLLVLWQWINNGLSCRNNVDAWLHALCSFGLIWLPCAPSTPVCCRTFLLGRAGGTEGEFLGFLDGYSSTPEN